MTTTNDNWGLIGHGWAVALLKARIAAGRAGHAYLITGPAQIGKMTLALRLAQAVNCTGDTPPCGVCRTCDLIARGGHPDVQVVEPDGKTIKIEAIRDLQAMLSLHPYEARHRVAIIPVTKAIITDQAADALLKTVEEPPDATRLVLLAESAQQVLPTIVSRCQTLALRPVPAAEIAAALIARGAAADDARRLARLSGGRPGWAITALAQPELLELRAGIVQGILASLQLNRTGRFNYAEEIASNAALTLILETWQSWWRDVLLLAEGSRVEPVNADYEDVLRALAGQVTPEEAQRALRAVQRTIDAMAKYANTRLALDVMMLDMPFVGV